MRALVNTDYPEKPVEIRTVEEPRPAANEAVVEVRAMAINRGELRLMAGRPDGWRPGQDVAGIVVRAADDGSGPAEGERVVALVDQAGWAERVAAPTRRIGILPDNVSFEPAATLPVAGLTALRALRVGGSLLGSRLLITGAAGGVGHFAVQLASHAGAHVTAVVGRPDRGDHLREVGADGVIVGYEEYNGTFDLALESVGGVSLASCLHAMAADGMVVVFGNSAGEDTPLSFRDFRGARASVHGFHVYGTLGPPTFGEDLALLASLIGSGELEPHIGYEGSWEDPGRQSTRSATARSRARPCCGSKVPTRAPLCSWGLRPQPPVRPRGSLGPSVAKLGSQRLKAILRTNPREVT
jgi:NADPH2:quinone reductase